MKTSKLISGLVLLTILLPFSSCGRDDDFILPKETTSGKNTLGFKVDGEVFLRRQNSLFEPYNLVARYAKFNDSYFFTLIVKCEDRKGVLGFFSIEVAHPIQLNEELKIERGEFSIGTEFPEYLTENGGKVLFTRLDTIARIASGCFQFSPQRTVQGVEQSISITEGRFDVKLVDY